jgi:ribonuclease HI
MFEIYTDGGCSNNGAKDAIGAVGVVLTENNIEKFSHSQTFLGTTNNRMEYRAMIFAMKLCIKNKIENVKFYTDSNLLVQTITTWMYNWEKKGWRKSTSPKQIKNLDLVLELYELKSKLIKPEFFWVKAHAENIWNNRADELATDFSIENASTDEVNFEILKRYDVVDNLG